MPIGRSLGCFVWQIGLPRPSGQRGSKAQPAGNAAGSGGAPSIAHCIASKTFVTNAAFEVASDALQIFGGNGVSREYPMEKLIRDARASLIEDGCNEVLAIVGGARL